MTAIRNEISATLRALPQVKALRRFAQREAGQHMHAVDKLACAPLAPSVRVALLLEVAHRAVMAAATVTASGPVPVEVVRAVSPRPAMADELLTVGIDWRDRCAGCGLPFGPAARVGRCVPGRCAPVTGWEPRVVPELDGSGEWDG
jgi:hypothetical protein